MDTYDEIFAAWINDLRKARTEALSWWSGLLRSTALTDPAAAHAEIRLRWPAGPCSHPRIIALYRHYFLACEALNDRRDAVARQPSSIAQTSGWGEDDDEQESMIAPHAVLTDRLADVDVDLDEFMAGFVFVPIGIDDEGNTA